MSSADCQLAKKHPPTENKAAKGFAHARPRLDIARSQSPGHRESRGGRLLSRTRVRQAPAILFRDDAVKFYSNNP